MGEVRRGARAQAVMAAILIPPLVHLVPLHRLAPRLGKVTSRSLDPAVDSVRVAGWIDAILERLPWPWRSTCLKRSAVLYHLLRRAGVAVELRIGVRRPGPDQLAAHAWLIRDGQPFLEPRVRRTGDTGPLEEFAVIAQFPEKG